MQPAAPGGTNIRPRRAGQQQAGAAVRHTRQPTPLKLVRPPAVAGGVAALTHCGVACWSSTGCVGLSIATWAAHAVRLGNLAWPCRLCCGHLLIQQASHAVGCCGVVHRTEVGSVLAICNGKMLYHCARLFVSCWSGCQVAQKVPQQHPLHAGM